MSHHNIDQELCVCVCLSISFRFASHFLSLLVLPPRAVLIGCYLIRPPPPPAHNPEALKETEATAFLVRLSVVLRSGPLSPNQRFVCFCRPRLARLTVLELCPRVPAQPGSDWLGGDVLQPVCCHCGRHDDLMLPRSDYGL